MSHLGRNSVGAWPLLGRRVVLATVCGAAGRGVKLLAHCAFEAGAMHVEGCADNQLNDDDRIVLGCVGSSNDTAIVIAINPTTATLSKEVATLRGADPEWQP